MKSVLVAAAAIAAAVCAIAPAARAAPAKVAIVVCAPGSPGTTAEAQPAMTAFAAALSAKAGVTATASYYEAEDAGVAQLKTAGIGIVSLPLFLKYEHELGLTARLAVVQQGRPALEQWTLVANKGRIHAAADLANTTIVANTAFAPAFVRGVVLGAFGAVPASAKLSQSSAVLSALRRAANGEAVAVVLDGTQQAALATLPFASKLEVVAKSPAMPAGVVVTVGAAVSDKTWPAIAAALTGLRAAPAGAAALDGIRMDRFAELDAATLAAARKAYDAAGK